MKVTKGSWIRRVVKRDLKKKAKHFISPLFRYLTGIQVEGLINLENSDTQLEYLESKCNIVATCLKRYILKQLSVYKEDTKHYKVDFYKICIYAERKKKK